MKHVFEGFGYELCVDDNGNFLVMDWEGDILAICKSSLEAKKWMKDHKNSCHWKADGTWDWNRKDCAV